MKLSYFFAAAFAISFAMVLFGEAGLMSAYRQSQEKARLESRLQRLNSDKSGLEHRIDAIQRDPIALENEIRRSLSLVSEREILIKFQD